MTPAIPVMQEMMAPAVSFNINDTDLVQRLSEHQATKSCTSPGGTCDVTIVDQAGIDIAGLNEFIAAPANAKPLMKCILNCGYKGDPASPLTGQWINWTGYLNRAEYGFRNQVLRLSCIDDKPLIDTKIVKFSLGQTPQKAVEELLAAAGIADYYVDLSGAKTMRYNVAKNQTVKDLLGEIMNSAKIQFCWWFDWSGKFIWAPWEEVTGDFPGHFNFGYRVNVVKIAPVEADLITAGEIKEDKDKTKPVFDSGEPMGPIYDLETIPHPWIGPWYVVKLSGYANGAKELKTPPRAKDGLYRVDSVTHRGGQESRTAMRIRGLDA